MRGLAFISVVLLCFAAAAGEITCPAIIGDHMVLQSGKPVELWGTGTPGESVRAEFAGAAAESTVDATGSRRLVLPPLPPSGEPRTLRIQGSSTLEFSDVLVGEVWLCSGQSNMEKPLGLRQGQKPTDNHEEEIARANHPQLRLFQVPWHGRPKPGQLGLAWVACTPENLRQAEFSAAGYFFGREIHLRERGHTGRQPALRGRATPGQRTGGSALRPHRRRPDHK